MAAGPSFLHLRGAVDFSRFDFEPGTTTIDATTETIRLATAAQAGNEPALPAGVFQKWRDARGGAALVPCRRDGCECCAVMLAQRDGNIFVDRGNGLEPWAAVQREAHHHERDALRFGPPVASTSPPPLHEPRALARDCTGRLWLLENSVHHKHPGGVQRILVLAADTLQLLAVVPPPPDAHLIDLATCDKGVLVVDANPKNPGLWVQRFGGEWKRVKFNGAQPPPGAHPIAAAGRGDTLVALYRMASTDPPSAQIAVVTGDEATLFPLPDFHNPLPILVLPNGDLLIGEISGSPGDPGKMGFIEMILTPTGPRTKAAFGARGFDGRGFFLGCDDQPLVTTANGLRPVFSVLDAPNATEGTIETYALDAQTYGCAWHRVFLEVCLPPGTSMTVDVRTADDLYPDGVSRSPRPPTEGGAPDIDAIHFPLGSRAPYPDDVEGWMPLGTLDVRAAWADVPFPPPLPPDTVTTLEGLVKNPPGRYLWLRVHLFGTKRQTPALAAVRATFPRPSLLAYLPAFWRADPGAAAVMDQVLSLFEGMLTELDVRIDSLPDLFDPRVCPSEALDWLASFISLSLDSRLTDAVRRTLLEKGVSLFRQRGTRAGLIELTSIISGGNVDIIEGFQQRRSTLSVLGATIAGEPSSVLGPGFQLARDTTTATSASAQQWEIKLTNAYNDLLSKRAGEDPPCPAYFTTTTPPYFSTNPPNPLDPDPFITFVRRYAHRFTVVIFQPYAQTLADILNTAIEANKPAHTVHDLCWMDAGFRLGITTYVGFGTSLGDTAGFEPAVLGTSPIGAPTILSTASPTRVLGTFVGAARVGDSTYQ